MKNSPKWLLLANVFGALGYMSCLMLWAWVGVVYLPVALSNKHVDSLLIPTPPDDKAALSLAPESSPVMIFIALTLTVIVMVVAIIVLLRAPITIAKTGKTITTKAANSTAPLIIRDKSLLPAAKKRLTARLIKVFKLLIIMLPAVVAYVGLLLGVDIPLDPPELSILLACILATIAMVWFSLQYIFARACRLDPEELV